MVEALRLRTVVPSNWSTGLPIAVQQGLFVTPAVDGWVFAVGVDAFQRGSTESVGQALQRLAATCGPAFWFATHAHHDVHGWACSDGSRIVRAYLYEGSDPRVLWDEGVTTPAEAELDFFVEDPRDTSDEDIKWWPTPADVLALAERWTVHPCSLDRHTTPGVGWFGRL